MEESILDVVYEVYGNELPDSRLLYNSMKNKPVSVAAILKKFKRWDKFVASYTEHCVSKRPVKVVVKTKPLVSKTTRSLDV